MSNVHRTVGEEEAGVENWFQRLPDDVVLHIFGKLSDVKWLCRCFVVAKRFSALIPLVQTVSFVTKTWNSVFSIEEGDLQGTIFLGKFSGFLTNNFKLTRLPSQRLNFHDVVFRLKQIESLNIELPSHFNANNDSVFKWGANFTTTILESFTFLYAASLSKTDEEKDRKETENEITQDELVRRVNLALDCFKNAMLRSGILSCAVRTCSMLQSITITDLKNKGVKLCLAGEKLVQCRNTLEVSPTISSENFGLWALENMRGGYVPVLQLPISGYVMKGVTIVDFNKFAFDDTSMLDAFAEEKGVFSEAVVQILEKHKGSIKALF
ncbi:F-box protein At4g18380-like [Rhododendron vialii]|uniref:F-box protein At4g18380-like n=1 Tax=Rhododendron vialii TaxID=182163 RepID=UPI00265DC6F7|nr:F-box protein At4g18380-like [Rhododendron vialii]